MISKRPGDPKDASLVGTELYDANSSASLGERRKVGLCLEPSALPKVNCRSEVESGQ